MKPKTFFLIILAAIMGKTALVLLTTIAQEVLFDGIHYYKSSTSELIIGGIVTLIAAILVGCAASLLIKNQNFWPHIIITFLIIAELTYLTMTCKTSGPLWFSFSSGFSLIVGVWFGYYFMKIIDENTSRFAS